jgi:hypothetical protein
VGSSEDVDRNGEIIRTYEMGNPANNPTYFVNLEGFSLSSFSGRKPAI